MIVKVEERCRRNNNKLWKMRNFQLEKFALFFCEKIEWGEGGWIYDVYEVMKFFHQVGIYDYKE